MNDEISQAMAAPAGQLEDEDLEAELEALQEAQLDEAMLNTGSVPVSDKIKDLPSAANGEREPTPECFKYVLGKQLTQLA